jgi:hypothetical protein
MTISKRLSIGAALAILGLFFVWRVIVVQRHFQQELTLIRQGMTKTEVVQIIGAPRRVKEPCFARDPNCKQDLVYTSPFDSVSFWTISIDRSGHVIQKYHWHSP